MYYLSEILNDKYVITSTLDNVSDLCSYEEVVQYCVNGIRIEGFHWTSNEELLKKSFVSIKPMGYCYVIQMEVGRFYNVTYKDVNGVTQAAMGYVNHIDTKNRDLVTLVGLDNSIIKFYYGNIIQFFVQQDIDPNILRIMRDRDKTMQAIETKKKLLEKEQAELRALYNMAESYRDKLAECQNVYTLEKFKSTLVKHLPTDIINGFLNSGYSFDTPDGVLYRSSNIYFTHQKNLGIRPESATFITREYDGQLIFTVDYEENSQYQSLLKIHRNYVDCKIPFKDYIIFSSKSLIYQGVYEIELDIKNNKLTDGYMSKILLSLV